MKRVDELDQVEVFIDNEPESIGILKDVRIDQTTKNCIIHGTISTGTLEELLEVQEIMKLRSSTKSYTFSNAVGLIDGANIITITTNQRFT